jgi:hypothetical protein
MSTDVGLFDEFIGEQMKDPFFQHCLFLAFPHDTFASITSNAASLLKAIDYLFESNLTTRLAFVCHSRGGLLARRAAASLYQSGPGRWKQQLAACVTFGTPHEGTPLAEHPSKLLGAGVATIRATQPGPFMGASDVLALVAAYGATIPGIDDLKPPTAIGKGYQSTTFVTDLSNDERSAAEQFQCRLQIFAIGGKGPHDNRILWISEKMFRGSPNDCAVPLSSSAPRRLVGVTYEEVQSDHFSYFTGRKGFGDAVKFLKQRMEQSYDLVLDHEIEVSRPRPPKTRHDKSGSEPGRSS